MHSTDHHVSQIYWPNSLCRRNLSGYVIGFNVNSFVVVVVGVRDIPVADAKHLDILANLDQHNIIIEPFLQQTQGPPKVVGHFKVKLKDGTDKYKVDKVAEDLWLVFENNFKYPRLIEVYSYGFRYPSSPQIVFYKQPHHRNHHVYSTEPLAIFPLGYASENYNLPNNVSASGTKKDAHIELTLKHIQYSWIFEQALTLSPENFRKLGDPEEVTTGTTFTMTKLITLLMFFFSFLRPVWSALSSVIFGIHPEVPTSSPSSRKSTTPDRKKHVAKPPTATTDSTLLSWRQSFWSSVVLQSYTAKLLQYRLSLFLAWPQVWSRRIFNGITWIHFYNRLALLCLDVILGIGVGVIIVNNITWFLALGERAHSWLNDYFLKLGIDWLMGSPAGFKLNLQLDLFWGKILLLYIENWENLCISFFSQYSYYFLKFLAIYGVFGLSSQLVLICDAILFINMHIFLLYSAISKAFFFQLYAVSSLWLLFRGKKKNVLKDRIDSIDYQPDQLLVGTLLFCVLCFLVPTTGIYYLFFLIAKSGVLSLIVIMNVILVLLCHFPLYGLLLYLSSSRQLSGGMKFQICKELHRHRSPSSTVSPSLAERSELGKVGDRTGSPLTSSHSHNQRSSSSLYLNLSPNPKISLGMLFEETVYMLKQIDINMSAFS